MIKAKLVMVGDQQKPTVIKIKKLPMTIGRGKEADLTLAHPMVSRLHCELYEVEGTLCIRDMGSLNGSFVGDVRVTEAALESGDLLTIGAATFKLVVGDETAGDDDIMPPTGAASKASEEATTMGDVDDDSFIEVDDEPLEEKKQEPKEEKKKSAAQVKPKESPEPKKEEAEQKEPKKEKKKKVKKKASSKTIGFDPDAIAAAADDAKDADDDDLSNFLANLK
jgi:pSer/pThr/pTyr-binding forkhead associated (FHA) protein